jgi:hypothetical protein
VRLEKFHVEHLSEFELQDAQKRYAILLDNLDCTNIDLVSAVHMGTVYCIAGLHKAWEGRAHGISFMSAHAGKVMRPLAHKLIEWMDSKQFKRIEITVDRGWAPGMRWADMLGFKLEGVMHSYYPHGGDAYLYARVRE